MPERRLTSWLTHIGDAAWEARRSKARHAGAQLIASQETRGPVEKPLLQGGGPCNDGALVDEEGGG